MRLHDFSLGAVVLRMGIRKSSPSATQTETMMAKSRLQERWVGNWMTIMKQVTEAETAIISNDLEVILSASWNFSGTAVQ